MLAIFHDTTSSKRSCQIQAGNIHNWPLLFLLVIRKMNVYWFCSLPSVLLINWWSSALLVLFWSRSWLGAWSCIQFAVRQFFKSTLFDWLSGSVRFATVHQNGSLSDWLPKSSDFNLRSSDRLFEAALKSNIQSTRSDTLLEASSSRVFTFPKQSALTPEIIDLHHPTATKRRPIVTRWLATKTLVGSRLQV